MDEDSILSLSIALALTLFAFLFSLSIFALKNASRSKLKKLSEKGKEKAKLCIDTVSEFDEVSASLQIGLNIAHIASMALICFAVWSEFGANYVLPYGAIATVVLYLFADVLPKNLGEKRSEYFALSLIGFVRFFVVFFKPITYISNALAKAFESQTVGETEVSVTEDELYDIIENMTEEGELNAEQGELISSALHFADVTVEAVLTARVDVCAIDIDDDKAEITETILTAKHSRLPVYRDSIDNIIGILQIKKYIKTALREGDDLELEELLDEAYFAHASTNIAELFPVMSRKKLNMAVVSDSYGGTLGIVTIEDILEELVGDIWDEDDVVSETFVKADDGTVLIDAEASVEDTFEFLEFEDPEDTEWEHKIIAEWAYEQFDLLPSEGDSFDYHGIAFEISEMQNRRIMKLTARMSVREVKE